jgi:23S rRNA (cytidine1920-2'-O)/16S rRNA (cytidine1409-2'-O)-methyltransferase
MIEKIRLDDWLVEHGFFENKSRARAFIMAGKVLVNGKKVDKAGTPTRLDAEVEVIGIPGKYVSRGGYKLEGALNAFPELKLEGKIGLDIGASTGGFTDCLLQRGVAKVYAVDVGYGQLAWKLREDPRVVNIERTNFRYCEKGFFVDPIEIVVADLSFISLEKILEPLKAHLAPLADCVMLIKPQFEVGKDQIASGGVVRDKQIRENAILRVIETAKSFGFEFVKGIDSSVPGAKKGNIEYLAWLRWDAQKIMNVTDKTVASTGTPETSL